MECAQGTLRSGFGMEKVSMDETWCMSTAAANGVSGEDLFVDEFLDFSYVFPDAEEQPQKLEEQGVEEQDGEKGSSVSHEKQAPPAPDFGYLTESVETVFTASAEGLENLEWLSHFVEESFSDYPLTGKLPPNQTEKRVEPPPPAAAGENPSFVSSVQTKARTKRARTGVRVRPVLSSSLTESTTSSSSSSSSTTSFSPLSPSQIIESYLRKPLYKRNKKKSPDATGFAASGVVSAAGQPRRCSHCGVTKTPQWRAGPLGSKTLCNACGVRFKSGRLLPEYRPACSPTFSSDIHSNNHRKVLEMRRKKDAEIEPSGLAPPVPSF